MEYNELLAYLTRNGFTGDGFIYKKQVDNITLTCRFKKYEIVCGVMYNELYYATISQDFDELRNIKALKLVYDKIVEELFKDMTTKLKQKISFL